jgi:hypothetical protein
MEFLSLEKSKQKENFFGQNRLNSLNLSIKVYINQLILKLYKKREILLRKYQNQINTTDQNKIKRICEKYNITNYTINDDGSIDVNGNVDLDQYGLKRIPVVFNKVTGWFDCSDNNLTTLKGSPLWVGGWFSCRVNNLTSLEFSPDYVGGNFYCNGNDLTNNYCDTEIDGGFYTDLKQDGLNWFNYKEWRKLYKRKLTLNELYTRNL